MHQRRHRRRPRALALRALGRQECVASRRSLRTDRPHRSSSQSASSHNRCQLACVASTSPISFVIVVLIIVVIIEPVAALRTTAATLQRRSSAAVRSRSSRRSAPACVLGFVVGAPFTEICVPRTDLPARDTTIRARWLVRRRRRVCFGARLSVVPLSVRRSKRSGARLRNRRQHGARAGSIVVDARLSSGRLTYGAQPNVNTGGLRPVSVVNMQPIGAQQQFSTGGPRPVTMVMSPLTQNAGMMNPVRRCRPTTDELTN